MEVYRPNEEVLVDVGSACRGAPRATLNGSQVATGREGPGAPSGMEGLVALLGSVAARD